MNEANGTAGDTSAGLKDLAAFVFDHFKSASALDYLASEIARKLAAHDLGPLIQEVALRVEAERELIRKTGIATYAIRYLQARGVELDLVKGSLNARPARLVTPQVKRLIWALKEELIRELSTQ